MTLRIFFAIMGAITLVSASAFLLLFQPPDKILRSKVAAERLTALFWIGLRERLLAGAVALGGLRLLVLNISAAQRPIIYDSWIDKYTSISTIIFSAIASCVSLAVYLRYRTWEAKKND